MPYQKLFFFCCLLLHHTIFSQHFIKGTIHDIDGKPIGLAEVYINNTSFSTVSNFDGSFSLNHDVQSPNDLIVYHKNYTTMVLPFDIKNNHIIPVKMTKKVVDIGVSEDEPYQKVKWKKWGKLFKEQFLGSTEASQQITIENENNIDLRWYKNSNRLVAICSQPLILFNKALGYKIHYDMNNFEYSFDDGKTNFSGFVYFSIIDNQPEIVANRKKVYEGSKQHFISSLYQNKISENGFQMFRMKKSLNTENQNFIFASSKNKRTPKTTQNQWENTDIVFSKSLVADSVVLRKNGETYLMFSNYLSITHLSFSNMVAVNTENYPIDFLKYNAINLNANKAVIIYPDGNVYPSEAMRQMYRWTITENIANLLPLDYVP